MPQKNSLQLEELSKIVADLILEDPNHLPEWLTDLLSKSVSDVLKIKEFLEFRDSGYYEYIEVNGKCKCNHKKDNKIIDTKEIETTELGNKLNDIIIERNKNYAS